jgi:hypothetical protein
MKVNPPMPRHKIEPAESGIRVAIPAPFNFGWAVLCAAVIIFCVVAAALSLPELILQSWIIGGVLLPALAISVLTSFLFLAWQLIGRESIIANPSGISHRLEVGPLRWVRDYDPGSITNLRLTPLSLPWSRWQRRQAMPLGSIMSGTIAFDYGSATVRMGVDLDQAEGQLVYAALLEALEPPHRADHSVAT